jgi:hypothetical protein
MSPEFPHARWSHARWALPAAAMLLSVACAASKPRNEPPAPAPPPLDASYDWHVLLIAPFGSVLKDVPLALHEVLLFRDAETAPASADEPECYAVNGTAPRFVARAPSEYLLCYKHDRLSRVEATVRLPLSQAEQILADACALWTKSAQAPKADTLKVAAPNPDGCEGADGGIAFAAHLETGGDDAQPDQADARLTIQLDAADLATAAAADRVPDR